MRLRILWMFKQCGSYTPFKMRRGSGAYPLLLETRKLILLFYYKGFRNFAQFLDVADY